jgi:hypothetical protein
VFKDTAVTARLADGRPLGMQLVPRAAMGDDRSQLEPGGLAAVADLVTSSQREPVAHELWREAWNLRHTNPRSSLVIGVAAAEVGLKQLIAASVPDAASLVENIPSPPLDVQRIVGVDLGHRLLPRQLRVIGDPRGPEPLGVLALVEGVPPRVPRWEPSASSRPRSVRSPRDRGRRA